MGNSVTGSSQEKHTLRYYDRLPRSVRAAIQEARFDWAVRFWLKQFEQGRMSAKELVKHIRTVDRNSALKQARRIWGKDYPIEVIK